MDAAEAEAVINLIKAAGGKMPTAEEIWADGNEYLDDLLTMLRAQLTSHPKLVDQPDEFVRAAASVFYEAMREDVTNQAFYAFQLALAAYRLASQP
jgi:hypothetical protein